MNNDRLLRKHEVLDRIGFRHTRFHKMLSAGEFPAPVRFGDRAVRWSEREVDEWLKARLAARADKAAADKATAA